MLGEERPDLVARWHVAEIRHCANQRGIGTENRQLRGERRPVLVDERQRPLARLGVAEEPREVDRRVLAAQLGAEGALQAAIDQRRIAEAAESVEIAVMRVRVGGLPGRGFERVEQFRVAVHRRGLHHRARHRRLDRNVGGERPIEGIARQVDDLGILGDRPQRVEHGGAQRAPIVGLGRRAREADLVEQRPQQRPHEGLELRARRGGRQVFADEAEPVGELVEHAARMLAAEAGRERQVVGNAMPAGARHRPFVVQ